MKRGGTFPRWRWRCSRWQDQNRCQQCFAPRGTAFVVRLGSGYWLANELVTHTSRWFSRRCDAKRWCERMLSEAERPPLTAPVDGRWIVFDRLAREYAEQQRRMLLSQSLLTMARRDLERMAELFGVDHDGTDGPAENGREE